MSELIRFQDPALLEYFEFEDHCDGSGFMTVEQLINVMMLKTDCFLTHDWGDGQANHKRVAEINKALKAKGLITWFDEVSYFCIVLCKAKFDQDIAFRKKWKEMCERRCWKESIIAGVS